MALLNAARRIAGPRIFVMGPGFTAAAIWAARAGAEVTAWTENLAEAETLRATSAAARLPAPRLLLQDDYAGLEPGFCDMALLLLPRGRALQVEALHATAALLRPGGRLVFVGATHEGVRSAVKDAATLFGRAGIVVRRAGYHAGLAERPAEGVPFPLPEVLYQTNLLPLEGQPTEVVSAAGVFSAGRVDEGAEALIAGMQVETGMRVLELGCGAGVVTLAALRRGAHAAAVDVSARAVAATQRTLSRNGYPDARVRLSIGAAAFGGEHFDVVLANPPFHKGHGMDFENARLFIADARHVLTLKGKAFFVANAFLNYEPWLKQHFTSVTCAWANARYRVWEAGV